MTDEGIYGTLVIPETNTPFLEVKENSKRAFEPVPGRLALSLSLCNFDSL
jgi:hypothetical protein